MDFAKKNFKIVLLPGDGIGPEIVDQAVKTLRAIENRFNQKFTLEYADFGAAAMDIHGIPFPLETKIACLKSDAILLGAVGDPKYDKDPSLTVRPEQGLLQIRKDLELFANIRPLKIYEALKNASPLKPEVIENVDIEIFRELTGGLYFGEKTLSADGTKASDICTYTENEIERITIKAYESARNRRKKLTLVDKANVLETSRLWRKVVQKWSGFYPDVETNYMYVDNAAMQLIVNPAQFDVILTENLFGDILSDEASVISGSIGLLPSASIGMNHALFEPIHGSFPEGKGKGIANPIATILSVALMMDHFQLSAEAEAIRQAVDQVIKVGLVTPDLNAVDQFSTSVVGDMIAYLIEDKQLSAETIYSKMKQSAMTII